MDVRFEGRWFVALSLPKDRDASIDETLYYTLSLRHLRVYMGTIDMLPGVNPVMDYHPIKGRRNTLSSMFHVTKTQGYGCGRLDALCFVCDTIETGRYSQIPRVNRLCPICGSNRIED